MSFAVTKGKKLLLIGVLLLAFLPSVGFVYVEFDTVGSKTSHCLFMPGHSAALCQANPLEHIQELQEMFVALAPIATLLTVGILLSTMAGFFIKLVFPPPLLFASVGIFLRPIRSRRTLLQEAYARGILNSRAF